MISRGDWWLTLRGLDGHVIQTERIEHPGKVDKKQPQRLSNRLFFYAGTKDGEIIFVEKAIDCPRCDGGRRPPEAPEGLDAECLRCGGSGKVDPSRSDIGSDDEEE